MPTLRCTETSSSPASTGSSNAAQDPRATTRAELGQRVLDAREHDRELVAAEAGDDVLRAHAVAQAAGDGDQQRVADGVAERVVDGLEVVDVDEQHARACRRRRASSSRTRSMNSVRFGSSVSGSW